MRKDILMAVACGVWSLTVAQEPETLYKLAYVPVEERENDPLCR